MVTQIAKKKSYVVVAYILQFVFGLLAGLNILLITLFI